MDHEMMRRLHGGGGGDFEKISHRIALISKSRIANDTWLFRFEKPAGFSYRAGQHVRMSLLSPRRPDPAGNYRFWSFASAPFEPDLAFAIRMRASPFKTRLAELPVGGEVQIDMLKTAPHGAFALDDATTPVVFLTGGIGVAPAWSMIKQALHDGSLRRLTLFYANRTREDAPFLDDLAALAEVSSRFEFVPTLTRTDMSEAWSGEKGRISAGMIERHIGSLKEPVYYISGLQGMVEALHDTLRKAGVSKSAIRSEEFGTFSMARSENKKRSAGVLPLAGGALLVAAVIGAHLAPVLFVTKAHPLEWLEAHPVSRGVAGVIVLVILIKAGLFLLLRGKSRRRH
jgi:ferredoxin-NADP reductase